MAKVCTECRESKGLIEFSIDRRQSDNKRLWCRACGRKRRRAKNQELPAGAPHEKPCSKCLIVQPHTEFGRTGRGGSPLEARCKTCQAAANSARYFKNVTESRRKTRVSYYKNIYGIDEATYASLQVIQNGRCAICTAQVHPLRVDHDHTTGVIRGLLCHNCNVGLGHFKDSCALLDSAKRYLNATTEDNQRTCDSAGVNVLRDTAPER